MFGGAFDVSHNNGLIKWSRIPKEFICVFIKASQGHSFMDPKFLDYKEGALDTGRLVIPYHFIDSSSAAEQAENFIDAGELERGSVSMLDWESDDPKMLPRQSIVEAIITLVRAKTQRDPIIYHGIYTLASPAINKCPWHCPKYGPQPKGKWLFWQNTPSSKIDGIPTYVDHDFFNGTEAELRTFYQDGTLPEAIR